MTFNMILAGVGGQGVLSTASILALAALDDGLFVTQSEVHGMAQRGGSVSAHVRFSDRPIASPLVPVGSADLVFATEILEGARQMPYCAVDGVVVSATTEVRAMNGYPDTEGVISILEGAARLLLLDAEAIAKEAGSARAAGTVLLGAAAQFLPVGADRITDRLHVVFARKSERVVDANLAAFAAGAFAAGAFAAGAVHER